MAGEKITDRLVSLADPDAMYSIGKGKLGKRDPVRLRLPARGDHREHAPRRPRPAPPRRLESRLAQRARAAAPRPLEKPTGSMFVYERPPSTAALTPVRPTPPCCPRRPFSSPGANSPSHGVRKKRLAGYRVGAEGRISHLKRGYGLRRSRLQVTTAASLGRPRRSSPTTSTPSQPEPSRTPETLPAARHPCDHSQTRPRYARPFQFPKPDFFRGK